MKVLSKPKLNRLTRKVAVNLWLIHKHYGLTELEKIVEAVRVLGTIDHREKE